MITSAGGDFSNVTLVLPSKRPYAFFRKEFSTRFKTPHLLPEFTTMHEWMQAACAYRIIGKDESVLMFYQYYKETERESAQPFDKFYSWATGVLNDFNETDKYLVNPQQLFVNLQHIKDIENWSFDTEQLSAGQEEFKSLWDKLPQYYTGYKEFLISKGLCTDGFAYRYMADHVQEYASGTLKNQKLFFVGLNALSRSEEKAVFTLANADRAVVYVEGHKGYIQHEVHEAGLFIRRYKTMGVKNMIIHETPVEGEKQVLIHECPGTVSQVLAAADLIRKIKAENRSEKVAVVLCDESLLIPFLQEMDKGAYNVTMGWPLIHATWFRYLVALTAWPDQLSVKKGVKRIALDYVKQLMGHPLSASVFNFSDKAKEEVKNHASFYVAETELNNWFGKDELLHNYLLADKTVAGKNLFNFFGELITRHLKKTEGRGNSGMDREVLQHLLKVIEKLNSLPRINDLAASNRLMRQLFISSCRNQPLAFLGEPLEGIQVMGMLESRCLSFDEVIIVSANEGILPGQSFSSGMIPYDLRFGHGLPGIREKEAVFAYYFYRLIQNSKTAHVLYASGGEALNRLEKSRYILQLESEGTQLFPSIKISTQTTSIKTTVTEYAFSVIKNSAASVNKIKEWMAAGVSVSALQRFLRCPKDFYYRYIAGLQELDSPEEWADDAAFGTLVHDTLYHMYLPLCGQKLEPKKLMGELARIDTYLAQALE
ncbi:MAG: PD-(D/E)XK nuclease family protein, partial [Flavobacteriales bacterium]